MNNFNARAILKVGTKEYEIYRLDALDKQGISTKHLPYSLRILLENLLRTEDGQNVKKEDIRALAAWNKTSKPDKETAFTPSRVLLQDFTGVPAIVDLAAMRDAMNRLGGDPTRLNPLCPAELVIDHSVQVDDFGSNLSFLTNANLEFVRNSARYAFLRGRLPEGSTATDLVLRVTEVLRKRGVVGKFVEFFGEGLAELPVADRATIANMAPEYGAACGIFPVDEETLRFLRFTGRDES